MDLKIFDRVQVCTLVQGETSYNGWGINKRSPQIGDIGYLMDILQAPSLPDKFVVEMSDSSDGTVIWLSALFREEFEPVAKTDGEVR
jgi:hypothetical protein